ncbi:AAA family ATPase [Mycobacteroides abscessus subsp. abscessus]|uniref:replicative DNA helicase n=1 Tax=Mycobacteroides abscessus TaxID=36809 RepID=UPI0005E55F26|nr:DnaB-like helicase C-terminal domain-containing protein [Mycobacteroides abscessus]MBN7458609.1 AAA family ATPase [Mycobacteroides abscessus subsp. abscessus]CPS10039.1 replicative DNA helicase [Mycobacteroides abscessus]CPU99223.1 replicative DNA helicase [Mycobacteroides abscessus]
MSGDREPAHDLRAEQGVIGALLLNPDVFSKLEGLRADHFYHPTNELLFTCIQGMYAEAVPIDAMTVFDRLRRSKDLRKSGGAPYLQTCMEHCNVPGNVGYYAQIVTEQWKIRTVNSLGQRFQALHDDPGEIPEALEAARSFLDQLDDMQEVYSLGFRDLYDQWSTAQEDDRPFLPTPWMNVNDQLGGGYQSQRLYVTGARPGCGKTIFGTQVSWHIAKQGYETLVFSLELSKDDLMGRLAACGTETPYKPIFRRKMDPSQQEKISRWAAENAEIRFTIDDEPDLTIEEIAQRCRVHKQRFGLDFVFIDYLQLVKSAKRFDSRVLEVDYIATMARSIARRLDCAVLVAAQLNRSLEQHNGKPRLPNKSDFRESGGIEQTADVAVILSRPPTSHGDDEDQGVPLMNACFVKNRQGPEDVVVLAERFDQMRFAA